MGFSFAVDSQHEQVFVELVVVLECCAPVAFVGEYQTSAGVALFARVVVGVVDSVELLQVE